MPAPIDTDDPAALLAAMADLLQASGALVSLKDAATGRYLWANPAWLAFAGIDSARLSATTDIDLLPAPDANEVRSADQRALAAALGAATGEHRFERGGHKLVFRTVRTAVHTAGGGGPLILSAWWDQSATQAQAAQHRALLEQLERQQAALDHLARSQREGRDRPTEVFRSEQFEGHLRREFALSTREHREFALALLAIDDPAALCAAHGDAALVQVAAALSHMLRTNTRAMDVITSLEQGRFAVLLSGVGLATAHTRIEQLRRQCATHVVVHQGRTVAFSIAGGVASFPHTASTMEELSQAAERALTHAVQSGNRVSLATIPLVPRPPIGD